MTIKDGADFYRVGVPLGSRLQMVVRRRGGWEVWTGLNNPALHPDHYVGNYLFLHDDGRVERVVRDADGFNDTMLIKRSDVDGNHT